MPLLIVHYEAVIASSLRETWVHPYVGAGLPGTINAQGMGYRRAIKPDVLAPGGRVVVQEYLGSTTEVVLDIYNHTLLPDQVVAVPGRTPGDRNATWCTRGTSNATALVCRAAALLYNVLDELRGDAGGEIIGYTRSRQEPFAPLVPETHIETV